MWSARALVNQHATLLWELRWWFMHLWPLEQDNSKYFYLIILTTSQEHHFTRFSSQANQISAQPVLVSIVVSIPACHAGDRGSIPRRGGNTPFNATLVGFQQLQCDSVHFMATTYNSATHHLWIETMQMEYLSSSCWTMHINTMFILVDSFPAKQVVSVAQSVSAFGC